MDKPLDAEFWNERYDLGQTGWDLGAVSPPLKAYIDQWEDKKARVLIPGCGNAHEARYLLESGFRHVSLLDISEAACKRVRDTLLPRFQGRVEVICGDFFAHSGRYELIIEQTFFCALDPALRGEYVAQMYRLLSSGATLAGLLFDRSFEGGPPFGGSRAEYILLFEQKLRIHALDACYNSAAPRQGTELFCIFKKPSENARYES